MGCLDVVVRFLHSLWIKILLACYDEWCGGGAWIILVPVDWASPRPPIVANTMTPCDRVKALSLDEWSDWG